MAELIELYEDDDGFFPAVDQEGTHRISAALWNRYRAAVNKLADLYDLIEEQAVRPVYVTPEQEDALRSVVKDGAWIIVREAEVVREMPTLAVVATETGFDVIDAAPAPVAEAFPPVVPSGPPRRPRPGPCDARGGLPHGILRYVITEAQSVYDPGRMRVDGLCQCGTRIPDVKCPHMKQELNAANQPACKWCHQQIVSDAGAIDNRNLAWNGRSADGAADPRVVLPVPANASADEVPIDAYRAPGA